MLLNLKQIFPMSVLEDLVPRSLAKKLAKLHASHCQVIFSNAYPYVLFCFVSLCVTFCYVQEYFTSIEVIHATYWHFKFMTTLHHSNALVINGDDISHILHIFGFTPLWTSLSQCIMLDIFVSINIKE